MRGKGLRIFPLHPLFFNVYLTVYHTTMCKEMSAQEKLNILWPIINEEADKDRELFAKLEAGEITFEEYRSTTPKYNSTKVVDKARELGIEL